MIQTVNGLTLPVANRTAPLYFLTVAVAYPGVIAYVGLLGKFLVSQRNVYRRQTAIILGAVLLTAIGSVVFRIGLGPHPGLDLTPVFYAVEAVTIAGVLFHYDFLDVEPLAPDIVIQEMEDPVLFYDDSETLLHSNPAAAALFGDEDPTGGDVATILPGLYEALARETTFEHENEGGDSVAVYDLNQTPIYDQYDRERGSVVVFRDVSIQKQREKILDELQSVNQRFLAAETRNEVAAIAVEAAERVLGYPYSGAMLYEADEDVLRMAAVADPLFDIFRDINVAPPSREVTRIDSEETTSFPAIRRGENDPWQVFESGEPMLGDPTTFEGDQSVPVSLGRSCLFPLGEHGILGISSGPDHDAFTDDDRQFVRALASATENALDRVKKERELRESRTQLEQRKEQIEFFNSVLRHDLLNGMTVVQGHAERLSDHVDETGAGYLETITEYSDDIVTLTQKVRSVIKEVTDQTDPDLQIVDLSDAIKQKVEKHRRSHEQTTIKVAIDDELRVIGDDLLPEVIENLILNAIEHNDTDAPLVTIQAVRREDAIHVRIADNGPGIPDDMKNIVFDERVTGNESGSIGFGLYFVKFMMERYGGSVWFEDGHEKAAPSRTANELDEPDGAVAVLSFPATATGDDIDTAPSEAFK